jgi:cation transport ATPase
MHPEVRQDGPGNCPRCGTLTEGKPRSEAVASPDLTEDEVLRLAASLDQGSEHPLALAKADLRGIAQARTLSGDQAS